MWELANCNTLPVPSCHATRREHEHLDTGRFPKPRQEESRGRGRVRTTDPPRRSTLEFLKALFWD
ncbi:hypothetical protein T265_06599 [Opisthorchis viverrini]|uniref:Uncharacterized protein n=1 Tax=Opisthorchis viverrini TaxID=6198 RepID=A0A074ZRZ4_OPIVI|nr:hypothetical protein T265_06599 [Opisthorchis viverrini]KER26120.1 hypothetical protein T265_06599 [Opisthorchis viverrini]